MPRPCKKRRVCAIPQNREFAPCGESNNTLPICVQMTVDEYEAIRLIDYEGMTQEECARQMNISRASISSIIENAHKKVADMLVNGNKLEITGGHISICEHVHGCCGKCGQCNGANKVQ